MADATGTVSKYLRRSSDTWTQNRLLCELHVVSLAADSIHILATATVGQKHAAKKVIVG